MNNENIRGARMSGGATGRKKIAAREKEIRALYECAGMSVAALAKRYGLSPATVRRALYVRKTGSRK